MNNELIQLWQRIIKGDNKSWVLFENGTIVILMNPESDLSAQAVALLQEWGPVYVGSSAGDFSIITLEDEDGWVVTSHHNDILTFVGPDEVNKDSSDLIVGLLGRSKRNQDAEQLNIIHVENRRQIS